MWVRRLFAALAVKMGLVAPARTSVSPASPPVGTPPQDLEHPEPVGRSARKPRHMRSRRRRLLRTVIVAPLVVVLLWAAFSYTAWMLRPTSLSWSVNSVEWVRYKVPFGNWVVDQVEQIYYSRHSAEEGRAAAEEPAEGRGEAIRGSTPATQARAVAAADHAGLRRARYPAKGSGSPTGPPVDGGPPMLVTTYRPDPTTRRSSPTSPGSTTRAPNSGTTRAVTSRRTRPYAGR